jgi:16S rRNA A1518/A1519 N6-dimethyltransferase RsmA/KsgA/DIM1 with predicted DNA glycosylase/AP lyase activity
VAAKRPRHRRPAAAGQHFLGRRIAAEVVGRARFGGTDLVVEIGAGRGILTSEISSRCGRVLAVELDTVLARRLRNRFDSVPNVTIVHGDALRIGFPSRPFRAFGNVPFGITNELIRRLLSERALMRGDLIVQEDVARELTAARPRSVLALSASPWWRLERGLRLPAHLFHPRPSVDASVLTFTRRERPMVEERHRAAYLQLVRNAFRNAGAPLPRALSSVGRSREIRGALREIGIGPSARAVDLCAEEFVALVAALSRVSRAR